MTLGTRSPSFKCFLAAAERKRDGFTINEERETTRLARAEGNMIAKMEMEMGEKKKKKKKEYLKELRNCVI